MFALVDPKISEEKMEPNQVTVGCVVYHDYYHLIYEKVYAVNEREQKKFL